MTTAVPRRLGSLRYRAASWLAALVLALNVLVPVLVNGPAVGATGVANPPGGQVIICTPAGMRVISLDGESRSLPDSNGGAPAFCTFCLPLVNAGMGALSAVSVVLPPPSVERLSLRLPGDGVVALTSSTHRLPGARAPPVLAA